MQPHIQKPSSTQKFGVIPPTPWLLGACCLVPCLRGHPTVPTAQANLHAPRSVSLLASGSTFCTSISGSPCTTHRHHCKKASRQQWSRGGEESECQQSCSREQAVRSHALNHEAAHKRNQLLLFAAACRAAGAVASHCVVPQRTCIASAFASVTSSCRPSTRFHRQSSGLTAANRGPSACRWQGSKSTAAVDHALQACVLASPGSRRSNAAGLSLQLTAAMQHARLLTSSCASLQCHTCTQSTAATRHTAHPARAAGPAAPLAACPGQ